MESKNQSKHAPVESLNPNTTMARAYLLMDKHGCNALPVLQEGELVGVVALDEIQKLVSGYADRRDTPSARLIVGNFMMSAVTKGSSDQSLAEAISQMLEGKKRALVVTQGSEIVGVLSESGLLKFLADLCKQNNISLSDALKNNLKAPTTN